MKRTPLYPAYADRARFIEFYGWEMPVWFTSIEREHMAVRKSAGVFDISHMKRTYVKGKQAPHYLDYLCGAKPSALRVGQLAYTHVLNHRGGIIDDGIVFRLSQEEFLFVTNACTATRLSAWMREILDLKGFEAELEELGPKEAMIALQGPSSLLFFKAVTGIDMSSTRKFECVLQSQLIVSRSGYTGEDGLEIVGPSEQVLELFEKLLKSGVEPCGLGARDTLRLEMGYPLACVDFNEDTTPLEMGAQRFIDFTKDFVGKEALLNANPTKLMRGILTDERVVLRGGYTVRCPPNVQTKLTSGTLSPILGKGIGLAFFPPETPLGAKVEVEVRGKAYSASIVKPPFIKR